MGGINVRVRPIHDVDVVGGEEARMCGREEGRAQRLSAIRGSPMPMDLCWSCGGSLAACCPGVWRPSPSAALAAVARCAGASLDRCAFVEVCSGPKAGALRALGPFLLREASAAGAWPSVDAS